MDAAAAKTLTDAEIDREIEKFMKRFDRWVTRAASKGDNQLSICTFHIKPVRIERYARHLRALGYGVDMDSPYYFMSVHWS